MTKRKAIDRNQRVDVAICTGCKYVIYPGPYFTRRIIRHLALLWHAGHEAVELKPIPLAKKARSK